MKYRYQIINLNDKPLYRRSAFAPRDIGSSIGPRLLLCFLISVLTGAFFWAYDAVAHRQAPYVAFRTQSPPKIMSYRSPAAAPAPDMNSPEVKFANADVEAIAPPTRETEKNHKKLAQVPPKPKKARVAKRRIPKSAMQAFAWGPPHFPAPWGGY